MANVALNALANQIILTRFENMWGDDQLRKNFTAKADLLNAILNHQTATATRLTDTNKDYDLKVNWFRLADETVGSFDPTVKGPARCNIDGPELIAADKEYKLRFGTTKSFKIEETGSTDKDGLRGIDANLAEMAARGMLQARKALVEEMAKNTAVKLDSFAGKNKYTAGEYADDATTPTGDTIIPAADFGAYKVLPYLAAVQDMNSYVNPYILDSGLLYRDMYMARVGDTAANRVEMQTLFGQFDITQDMKNFAAAGLADRLYLVDASAVAFFSKNQFTTTPRDLGINGLVNYAIPLPELGNNVYADVVYQFKCEDDKYYHVWQLEARYDLLDNPTIADPDLTGVLAFRKGA